MKTVATQFVPYLEAVKWQPRAFPVVNNLDAKLRDEGDLDPFLRDQIDHPVLWTGCVQELKKQGITHYVEMGPGRVLTGLVNRIVDDAAIFSLDSIDEFNAFEQKWKENFK